MLEAKVITVLAISVGVGLVIVETEALVGAPGTLCVIAAGRSTSERSRRQPEKRYLPVLDVKYSSLHMKWIPITFPYIVSTFCVEADLLCKSVHIILQNSFSN